MAQATAMLTGEQLSRLREAFDGEIVTPADDGYDEARRLWNAVHDRRPAVIVRPTTTAEVATAIRFARDHDLELAVRSGGHSGPGHSSCDGGLVVDLSRMRGVTVDAERRTARANGGALLGELDVAAQAHGLVVPDRRHRSHRRRRAHARRRRRPAPAALRPDDRQPPRGRARHRRRPGRPGKRNGGARAVLGHPRGRLEFRDRDGVRVRAAPVRARTCTGASGSTRRPSRKVFDVFREYAATGPDTVSAIYGINLAEPASEYPESVAGQPIVVVAFNHSGRADAVEADTAGLRRGPEPISVSGGSPPYLEVQTAHDLALGWGRRSFIKSLYADDVRPEALDELVAHIASGPSEASFSITAQGGAIARVDEDAMAFTGRAARFDLSADSSWDDATEDEVNPPGSGGRWRSSSRMRPWVGTSTGIRTRAGRDPGVLRRRQARPPGPAQARLGPRQRVPPEPQHHAGAGLNTCSISPSSAPVLPGPTSPTRR